MKKKMIIAGLLALTITMVMFVSIAAAGPTLSTLVISGPGVVWQFTPPEGEITDIQAYYYIVGDLENPIPMPSPIKTNIRDNLVTLIFSYSDTGVLSGNVVQTKVTFLVNGVENTIPGGPGFAWGRTR